MNAAEVNALAQLRFGKWKHDFEAKVVKSDNAKKNIRIADEQVLALYGQKSVNETARELGVSRTAVLKRAKKLGITRREKRKNVIQEIQRKQGEEIMKRLDEFAPQLKEWMNMLRQNMADCQTLLQYLKDRAQEEANKPRVNNDRINRYFKQIRRVIRTEGETLSPLLVLISALLDSKNMWEELFSDSSLWKGR